MKKETGLDNLEDKIKKLQGKYGTKVRKASEVIKLSSKRCISSGNLSIDWSCGGYGIPRGRIVEFFGPESSGKTALALTFISQAQKLGIPCAFVDAEHGVTLDYFKLFGVDSESLLLMDPEYGEQAFEFIEDVMGSHKLIVVDSVTALMPKAEDAADHEKSNMALQARMMSQSLRKIVGKLHDNDTTVIFINQEREKVGVMFGSPITTSGGNALKFYSAVRARIVKTGFISPPTTKANDKEIKEEDFLGQDCEIRNFKSKCGPPRRKVPFQLFYGKDHRMGIIPESAYLDRGIAIGVITRSGAWYSFEDKKIGNGRDNVIERLSTDPDLSLKIKTAIMKKHEEQDNNLGVKMASEIEVESDVSDFEDEAENKKPVMKPVDGIINSTEFTKREKRKK